jgi:hypothetical protein
MLMHNGGNHAANGPQVDLNQPLSLAQAVELFDTISQRTETRIMQTLKASQPAPAAPYTTTKRKADDITNEGIKKQYIPLEETKLRLEAMREKLQTVTKGVQPAIGPEEAAELQKTIDEGLDLVSRRICHLEIARTEG